MGIRQALDSADAEWILDGATHVNVVLRLARRYLRKLLLIPELKRDLIPCKHDFGRASTEASW